MENKPTMKKTKQDFILCVLCKGEIRKHPLHPKNFSKEFWGHNPQPLSEGRCCDTCNTTKVIPARIAQIKQYKK